MVCDIKYAKMLSGMSCNPQIIMLQIEGLYFTVSACDAELEKYKQKGPRGAEAA